MLGVQGESGCHSPRCVSFSPCGELLSCRSNMNLGLGLREPLPKQGSGASPKIRGTYLLGGSL